MFNFKGRINRRTFWMGRLTYFLLFLIPMIFAIIVTATFLRSLPYIPQLIIALGIIAIMLADFIIFFIASLALTVKRAHDTGSDGMLWAVLEVFTGVTTIIVGLMPGETQTNRFGEPPAQKVDLNPLLRLRR